MAICIIASIIPKPEFHDAMEQALRTLVEQTRKEPGNLRYDLFARVDNVDAFEMFEIYTDQAAVDAHRESRHFQGFVAQAGDWLSAPIEVRLSQPVDVAPF